MSRQWGEKMPGLDLGGLLLIPALLVILLVSACGAPTIGASEREHPPREESEHEEREGLAAAKSLAGKRTPRGWIHSVLVRPARVNKDGALRASADWGPAGNPEMALRYKWFVNNRKVASSASERLPLSAFRSGDRVYALAQVLLKNQKVIASRRSRSVVIQNRAPKFDAGLRSLQRKGDALVGHVSASDPDGDFFTMRLIDGPGGLALDPDGIIQWPLASVKPGAQEITIELEDERGLGFRGTLAFSVKREG